MVSETRSPERTKAGAEMTVRQLYDHLMLERAKIDRQLESLRPFLPELGATAPAGALPPLPALPAQGRKAGSTRGGRRNIPVAEFILGRLKRDETTALSALADALAAEYHLSKFKGREKVKSSLKDLVRRGRVVRGSPGAYRLP